jgi:hypothetical protein
MQGDGTFVRRKHGHGKARNAQAELLKALA